MRTPPPNPPSLHLNPLKEAVVGVVVLFGFFASFVTLAHPFIAVAFVAGLLSSVVLTAGALVLSRPRTLSIPGSDLRIRFDSE